MAKKVSSNKDKKTQRKAETERLQQLKRLLQELNDADDLLADFPAFCTYDRRGLAAQLRFHTAAALPLGLLDWALALTRMHMQPLYDACPALTDGCGWSDEKKRGELADPAARFIVAYMRPAAAGEGAGAAAEPAAVSEAGQRHGVLGRAGAQGAAEQQQGQQQGQGGLGNGAAAPPPAPQGAPVGFVHFRWEEEEAEPVAYLYEIQVEAAAQGKGLGGHLMRLLELLAFRRGAARVMLTVLHANTGAAALYHKLGYAVDDSSPELHDPTGDAGYQILTKRRRQAA